jgi:hypothetical protein
MSPDRDGTEFRDSLKPRKMEQLYWRCKGGQFPVLLLIP